MASGVSSRLILQSNPSFVRSGLRSYAKTLLKHNFDPTKPGPYQFPTNVQQQETAVAGGGQKPLAQHKQAHSRKLLKFPLESSHEHEAGEVPAKDVAGDTEYICPIKIGTPPQTFHLDLDTGSSDLWLWSTKLPEKIRNEHGKDHSIYDPSKSHTHNDASQYTWTIGYEDGSGASGTVCTDVVDLGGVKVHNQAIELATKISDMFLADPSDGMLGLGWSNSNNVSPHPVQTVVANMILQGDIPKDAELFTAHLSRPKERHDGDNFFTFGFIDQDALKAAGATEKDISWAHVDNSQGYWLFDSPSASVDGKNIERKRNVAIADTGTTISCVSDNVCDAIYAAIPGAKYNKKQQGWVFPKSTKADKLPVVKFAVGDKLFTIDKEDLAYSDNGDGTIYGGVQSRGNLKYDILGDTFLKSIYAIFDQGNTRFGAVQRKLSS